MGGLLEVAGMMTLLVMKWIIPENSLLSTGKPYLPEIVSVSFNNSFQALLPVEKRIVSSA